MPLEGLVPRTSDFTPYLKFNSKAGRWYTKNDEGMEVEVKDLTAIFDLPQIKIGWLMFAEGTAPDVLWDNGKMAQKPSPKHKRGFSVNVYSQKLGGLREYSSNSNASIVSIKTLYDEYELAPEAQRGMVPVVSSSDQVAVKSKFGTNYQPVFTIVKWVPRPGDMPLNASLSGHIQTQVPLPVSGNGAPINHEGVDEDSAEEF